MSGSRTGPTDRRALVHRRGGALTVGPAAARMLRRGTRTSRAWAAAVTAGGAHRLAVDVLGPIRIRDAAGRDLTPDGALQRRLLALLVLRRGRVVPAEAAIDALWPDHPPREPLAALHSHLSRLRRGLPSDVITSTASGYRLDPARIDLDADRLADALGGEGAAAARLATIEAALGRWQSPAYPELEDTDDGRAESARLGELRLRAAETRGELRLAAGDTDGLVAELGALADGDPLRERPRALLMAALAGTGRTVEALRVYDDFRRLLGDELGIEPSPVLVAQHAELLAVGGLATWAPASWLPVPVTSLVGREALVDEVIELVDGHRLVTLVGPGGVGKTRLLVEVGHRLRARRTDRPVVLCELATATGDAAVDAVAAALGIDARPGVPMADRLARVLGDSALVLLLDNCEHVLDAVAELVERLLASCPEVQLVATSRERLRVAAEQLCAVPTLSTDAPHAPGGAGPAVELFVQRARAVAPGFDPDPGERAAIARIVARLDGLPLAIELAAARLHTLDVAEVAAGLDRRFTLLSSGYRTSTRHGSLSAAVSWSFELLDERLQRTFADLSIFAGSFTAADAAAICGLEPAAVVEALAQLTERSLVMRAPDRRYVLLETLRAFGAEQLAAHGRAAEVGERHAHHLLDWAAEAERRLAEPGGTALADIDAALSELRNALAWLVDHDQVAPAARLVTSLVHYGFFRLRPDVMAWSERVIDADPDDRAPDAPRVWVAAAYAAWMAGDVTETAVRSRRALRAAERAAERDGELGGGALPEMVSAVCGNVELFEGRLEEAIGWYRRAAQAAAHDPRMRRFIDSTELLALAYAGDPTAAGRAEELLAEFGGQVTSYGAYLWYCAGEAVLATDVEAARARFVRAVELAEPTGTSFVTGVAGASKASIDARLGDPLVAADDYRRLLDHWRRAGMWSTQWTMLRSIAGLLDRLGRHRDAAVLEGAVRSPGTGHRIFGVDEVALADLGVRLRAALGDGAYEAARQEGASLDGDAAVQHALRAL